MNESDGGHCKKKDSWLARTFCLGGRDKSNPDTIGDKYLSHVAMLPI